MMLGRFRATVEIRKLGGLWTNAMQCGTIGKCKDLLKSLNKSEVDADNLKACKVFTILRATTLVKTMVNMIEAVAVAKLVIPGFQMLIKNSRKSTRRFASKTCKMCKTV